MRPTQPRHRSRQDRGVALVEFALVSLLLFMLIFGIIGYAYMMSFQQSLTQAAAEGARAGAVAITDEEVADATAAVESALQAYDEDLACNEGPMHCDIQLRPCGDNDCIEVVLSYDYRSNPLLPSVPLVNLTLPETVNYTASAEVGPEDSE